MHSLTLGIGGGQRSPSRPDRFIAGGQSPGAQCVGRWVGPRAGLDAVPTYKKG